MHTPMKACEVINLMDKTVRDLKELDTVISGMAEAITEVASKPRPWWDLNGRLFGSSAQLARSTYATAAVTVQLSVLYMRLNSMLTLANMVDSQATIQVDHEDLFHLSSAKELLKKVKIVDGGLETHGD